MVWEMAPRALIRATKALSELQWHPRDLYAPNKWILKSSTAKYWSRLKAAVSKLKESINGPGTHHFVHEFVPSIFSRQFSVSPQLLPAISQRQGRDVFLAPNS